MITTLIVLFVAGYTFIVLEHYVKVDKTAIALLTGVTCWAVFMLSGADTSWVTDQLLKHLSDTAGILFFIMGAMTIVELIDAHDGFRTITDAITTRSDKKILWITAGITFFMSALLDNLTTTIVMVTLLSKVTTNKKNFKLLASMVIIAANAGGAWTPIGDITTTMLWIGGQISSFVTIRELLLPSLVCTLIPLIVLTFFIAPTGTVLESKPSTVSKLSSTERTIVFFLGLGALLFVPLFKAITHLPPYMGMLFGLGIMWIIIGIMHTGKDEEEQSDYSVASALRRIDLSTILFFLGILLCIAALQSSGILHAAAQYLERTLHNQHSIVLVIGLLSSIVDNVPLTAAVMGMYNLSSYPMNHELWQFLAYAVGTGGSCLIIGSAAGVTAMGMAKIDFMWYLKRIMPLALLGYLAGAGCFILLRSL